jgi:hypothetical protein
MNVSWLIDPEMFEGYRDELIACIRAQGHEVLAVRTPSPPYRWDDVGFSYRKTFPQEACVVAHGDIGLVTRILQDKRWTPGAFGAIENLACSSYYCWFGKYLLNRDYVMLPFGELSRQMEFLFDVVGQSNRIFVRPDSPLKLFTGQVATRDTFAADLEYMGFYDFPPNSMVVVCPPQAIEKEWRFVVANKRIVTGCQYKSAGEMNLQSGYEEGALSLASEIASGDHEPDPAWIMDICRTTDGAYHLLEIGGFSFADLYVCDMSAIVEAVSEVAITEWQRAHVTAGS